MFLTVPACSRIFPLHPTLNVGKDVGKGEPPNGQTDGTEVQGGDGGGDVRRRRRALSERCAGWLEVLDSTAHGSGQGGRTSALAASLLSPLRRREKRRLRTGGLHVGEATRWQGNGRRRRPPFGKRPRKPARRCNRDGETSRRQRNGMASLRSAPIWPSGTSGLIL